MKPPKITFFILFFLVNTCVFSFAQAPQKVSYQSVIRDVSGELVRSQPVGMQISILQGSSSGTAVYVETHAPTTNINGLASVEVGNGTPTGGTLFSDIEWVDGPYYLKVETDPSADGGISYSITGTTEILSVPFALQANSVKGTIDADNSVVSNVAEPVDDQDAATKMYVDNLLSTIQIVQNGFVDPRDGNLYSTVLIGNQLWMAENLVYLPEVSPPADGSEDGDGTEPYYYVYDYSGTDVSAAKANGNYETYGVLYNWPAAVDACPAGWHLPSDAEWTKLGKYLSDNGYGYEGSGSDIGKALASTTLWQSDGTAGNVGNDLASNNSSGFGALPGGYRNPDKFGGYFFFNVGFDSYWWSDSESGSPNAWYRSLYYNLSDVYRNIYGREYGFSVRCVRDN